MTGKLNVGNLQLFVLALFCVSLPLNVSDLSVQHQDTEDILSNSLTLWSFVSLLFSWLVCGLIFPSLEELMSNVFLCS